MSKYVPQDGDRVRVVLEGHVKCRSDDAGFFLHIRGTAATSWVDHRAVVSAERITPALPTTPGSVVRIPGVGMAHLGENGFWTTDSLRRHREIAGFLNVTVLFDAGAKP